MAIADLLLEQMFSWIEQRKLCGEQLMKLAQELESLRRKCNISECFGSSASVVGASCLIFASVATLLTGGAAAPLLGVAGGVLTGGGIAISEGTKITEQFLSNDTMKEAQKIEEKSRKIADKIQELFQQLKAEVKNVSSSADPDEVDQRIMAEVLRAVAQRNGLKGDIDFSILVNETGFLSYAEPIRGTFNPAVIVGLVGILAFFTFKGSVKKINLLIRKGVKQVFKQMSTIGLKTALKGGAMVVGGAVGLAFALPEAIDDWKGLIENNHVTEASQSLRDTADAILKISQTLRSQFDNITQKLETLAQVNHCMENSNRSSEQKQTLIKFAVKYCKDEAVKKWLTEDLESQAFFKLMDMFHFLKQELDKKKKEIDCSKDLHITFVAHGQIRNPLIPASCLLPLPSITDVLLYSPWNCSIGAAVAYGVATGRIRPQHRRFSCRQDKGCRSPDERHQPTNLPHCWNSMKKAGGQKIPNILVSTLEKPEDGAWKGFEFLKDKYGQPERNRIIIPFILPGCIGSSVTVPFSVVTLALSLVLFLSKYKATVHLAACLSKISAGTTLNEDDLKMQYACTVDNTRMNPSEDMFPNRDSNLQRLLKAVFDKTSLCFRSF